ncbi:hypothetical protein PLICRDRAFT_49373 [Plicaturopsis crispa FD-325 SS-3]|nr:hypothetical protein PLICRDRAFT_49373 [Plicaturopsis crispa FD-325 SS-3]
MEKQQFIPGRRDASNLSEIARPFIPLSQSIVPPDELTVRNNGIPPNALLSLRRGRGTPADDRPRWDALGVGVSKSLRSREGLKASNRLGDARHDVREFLYEECVRYRSGYTTHQRSSTRGNRTIIYRSRLELIRNVRKTPPPMQAQTHRFVQGSSVKRRGCATRRWHRKKFIAHEHAPPEESARTMDTDRNSEESCRPRCGATRLAPFTHRSRLLQLKIRV